MGKRGFHTSWIQSTATLGLLLSLLVVLGCRYFTGDQFEVWGWRIPFLLSILLLGISTWIRLSLHESPAFLKMKEEGKCCKAPIRESFGKWENLKVVLIALFMGTIIVWSLLNPSKVPPADIEMSFGQKLRATGHLIPIVLLVVFSIALVTLLLDLIYPILDPRIMYGR